MARPSGKAKAEAERKRILEAAISALVESVRAAGAVRKIRSIYDGAQGGADIPEGSTEEEAQWIAHEYALEWVSLCLYDDKLLPPGFDELYLSDKEMRDVLDEMFSRIS